MLAWILGHEAQVSEVHIHNMQLQSAARTDALAAEQRAERKPLGFVAVAAGEGNARILESLGVDVVVSGGQTMNPSTKDLLDAVGKVNAEAVILLPNNSNIIMAAQSACDLADVPCAVVPTKSVPQAFAALFGVCEGAGLEENVASMTEAFSEVKTGEVTHAVKDAKDAAGNAIRTGNVIGIADGSIDVGGRGTVEGVVMDLLARMEAADADTLTVAGRRGPGRRGVGRAGGAHQGRLRRPGDARPPRRPAPVPHRHLGGVGGFRRSANAGTGRRCEGLVHATLAFCRGRAGGSPARPCIRPIWRTPPLSLT